MIERLSNVSGLSGQQQQVKGRGASKADFNELLQRELEGRTEAADEESLSVAFSKHAISRAEERGIEITPDLISQLKGSMVRAQAKGATNILAMDSEKAFIINVPNGKVITAITQDEMKDSVFTNIDGAVFL
jgi:flagellar operon protein